MSVQGGNCIVASDQQMGSMPEKIVNIRADIQGSATLQGIQTLENVRLQEGGEMGFVTNDWDFAWLLYWNPLLASISLNRLPSRRLISQS